MAEVGLDLSYEDSREELSIVEFLQTGCQCHLGPKNSPCFKQLAKKEIETSRLECSELTRDELDLVILSHISAHRTRSDETFRGRSEFFHHGKQVCTTTYLYLHGISRTRYTRLVEHYQDFGLCPRIHGNSKRLPSNALPFESTNHLTMFIKNYARAHGLPLPGRVPGHRDKVMVLPSDITKAHVYQVYKKACETNSWQAFGRTKFYELWSTLLPHISIGTPSSDLCFTCQQNSLSIQKAGCLSEEEKLQRMRVAQEHIALAKKEREYYKSQCKTAEIALESASDTRSPVKAHYSFDFAQQIHYPCNAQQTGPEYFKTARKCGLFGVCNDGCNKQVMYLIDEAENPGKGADSVVSMLHHFFATHAAGEQHTYLHADNCVGQNKNNCVVQYLMHRVLTGSEKSIELSFMLVGHTKFSPDRLFGSFKKAFRRSTVSTIYEIEQVVSSSTTNDQNVPQLIRDATGKVLVTFYQWTAYLSQFFKPIPNILQYHIFRVKSDKPGIVELQEFSDSPIVEEKIFKSKITKESIVGLPEPTEISGLSLQRQWYLFENIRQHCKSTLTADITCPQPLQPKPGSSSLATGTSEAAAPEALTSRMATTSNSTATPLPHTKRTVTCGICKAKGHTKRTCPQKH